MLKKIICLFLFFTVVTSVYAQEDILTSYDLFKLKQVIETAISPDAKYVAYTVNVQRPFSDEPGNNYKELYLLNLSSGESKLYMGGKKSFYALGWTPDSKQITFLANFDDVKHTQVYAMDVDGGDAFPVTNSKTSIQNYYWNPKNTSIAYISIERDNTRKSLIKKGFNAEIYEEDIPHKNLYLYDLKEKTTEQITKDVTVFSIRWSPNGDVLAAQIAEKNLVDYEYMFKNINIINPETKENKLLVDPPGKLEGMAWSPDGKHLAFVAGVDISDPVSGSLFVVPVPNNKKFAELRNYSKDFGGSVISAKWKDNSTVLYSANESVDVTLNEQNINEGERKILIQGGEVVFRGFTLAKGIVAFNGNTGKFPGELHTFNLKNKKLNKHTDCNPWLNNKKFAKQEKISYQARDGLTIEGVLMYPLNFKQGEKYPLIVYIHGGPESSEKNGWVTYYSMWGQVATAKDYFVFMPNYRASSGRGVAFSKMDQKDLGDEEFNDVLDGIDHLVKKGFVDNNKVGIGGGSYGGYFAAWAATKHSDRFAAAVVFVGVSDIVSKRYTTDIPYEAYYVHWTIWTHEDIELMYDRSPIKYITNNKTPTLILHGKKDPRVHPSQSLELYRSLKLHGKAPVRLVWYPEEGHGNRKNPARLDYSLRTMEWFDYYLKSDKPKDEMPDKDLEYDIDLD
ncbi:MAG: S9 family peptidase [Bacteroidota bacterium]